MTVLSELLRIKIFREKKAEQFLLVAKQNSKIAKINEINAKKNLLRHKQESAEEERKLYSDLCKKIVCIRDIDNLKIQVELMKIKEEELENEFQQMKELEVEARKKEQEATAQYTETVLIREKFDQMLQAENIERKFVEDRFQELEIEESAEAKFLLSRSF